VKPVPIVQHVGVEGPGRVAESLSEAGLSGSARSQSALSKRHLLKRGLKCLLKKVHDVAHALRQVAAAAVNDGNGQRL
jgi:hypothetical protein